MILRNYFHSSFLPQKKSLFILIVVFFLITFPSLGIIQKFSGIRGIIIFSLFSLSISFFFTSYLSSINNIREYPAKAFSLLLLSFLFILFFIIYPIANEGIWGGGSDSDDGLDEGVKELIYGRYPYYEKTYLNNSFLFQPGSLILAIPFVLIGKSAYQNLFWLVVFLLFLKEETKKFIWVVLALLLLLFSPVFLHELVTGGDLIANSIFVIISFYLVIRTARDFPDNTILMFFIAVFAGICLSSRLNFLLLVPLLFREIYQTNKSAMIIVVPVLIFSFLTVTLPFYFYDPGSFTPLKAVGKLNQFNSILPGAGIIITLITAAISFLLTFFSPKTGLSAFFRDCCFVQAFPFFSGILLQWIKTGILDWHFGNYGLMFMFFGVSALWISISVQMKKA